MTKNTRSPELVDQAREMARRTLARSASFQRMPVEEQRSLYLTTVDENYHQLASQSDRFARGMVDDFEDYDPGFDNSVDAFEDLVDSVDFPQLNQPQLQLRYCLASQWPHSAYERCHPCR